MEESAKISFVKGIVGSDRPEELPEFYIDFYDRLCGNWKVLLSNHRCPRTEWAMIATIAQSLHERDDRIASLEARLDALIPTSVEQEKKPILRPRQTDMRTKQGRALKAKDIVGIGADDG